MPQARRAATRLISSSRNAGQHAGEGEAPPTADNFTLVAVQQPFCANNSSIDNLTPLASSPAGPISPKGEADFGLLCGPMLWPGPFGPNPVALRAEPRPRNSRWKLQFHCNPGMLPQSLGYCPRFDIYGDIGSIQGLFSHNGKDDCSGFRGRPSCSFHGRKINPYQLSPRSSACAPRL